MVSLSACYILLFDLRLVVIKRRYMHLVCLGVELTDNFCTPAATSNAQSESHFCNCNTFFEIYREFSKNMVNCAHYQLFRMSRANHAVVHQLSYNQLCQLDETQTKTAHCAPQLEASTTHPHEAKEQACDSVST
jgi:hypothetical protein